VEHQQVGENRGRLKRGGRTVGLGDEHSSDAIGRAPVTLEGEAGGRLPGMETRESNPLISACTEPVSTLTSIDLVAGLADG
jgi:hypothetical protein